MNNFLAIFRGEFQKMFRGRKFVILVLIMIILCIVGTVIYEYSIDEMQSQQERNEQGIVIPEPNIDEQIIGLEIARITLEESYNKGEIRKFEYKEQLKNINAQKAKLEYIKANNIDPDIITFGTLSGSTGNKTAADYILFMMNLLFNAICIYVVVLASGTITNELKDGTMKLLLLRPIDRNKLLSIKIFSIVMLGVFLMGIIFSLSLIYGLIRFGASNLPILFIFNAKNVFVGTQVGQVALILLINFIMMFGFVEMSAFFATLSKNKAFAMAISIAIMLGITTSLIALLRFIGWNVFPWLFSSNVNWAMLFITPSPANPFYLTVIIYAVYVFLFSFLNHLVFSKRDVN